MGASWAEEEFRTLDLGDVRLNRRAARLVEALASQPGASIPKACGNEADTKAAYRLLSSEEVEAEEIRRAHAEATAERARGARRVLVAQDSTSLDYTRRSSLRGAGMLESEGGSGLMVHSALALEEGVPLGVLHQQVWARDRAQVGKRHTRRARPTREKESIRWVETLRACEQQLPLQVEAWVIGDRESDVFDLFAAQRRPGLELVVRSAQDRRVQSENGGRLLREAVQRAPVVGEMKVEVPRSGKRQARTARLEVQHCRMELLPPANHPERKTLSPVPVSVVRVREQGTVPADQEPIEWVLVTTVWVDSLAAAVEVVEAYTQRWKVERYHYVLKSGCRIEDLQLEHASRIERALALYNVVAWRLLRLTYWSRAEPEQPCTVALEEDEWKALWLIGAAKPLPKQVPKLRDAVRLIAKLGGFQGRKGDGEPGVQSLWWGFRRLMDFTLAYRRLSTGLMGNG